MAKINLFSLTKF